MADEHVIKISASQEGGGSTDQQLQKLAMMQAMAEKAEDKIDDISKKLLETFTFATADWEPAGKKGGARPGAGRPRKPPEPPKPPKAPPAPDDPGEDPEEEKAKLLKALRGLQKGIIAVDGVNGRLSKGMAAVIRGYDALNKSVTQFRLNNTNASASSGRAALAIGKIAGVAAATTAVFIGMIVAAKLLVRVIDNLTEQAGEFSAALNMAKAATRVQEIQNKMTAARQIGGELASLENSSRELTKTMFNFKTELIDLLSPAIKLIADQLTNMLKVLNLILIAFNMASDAIERVTEKLLSLLVDIPIVGIAAKKALDWMTQDQIDKAKASNLNIQIEELFDVNDMAIGIGPGNDRFSKNKVVGQFLPK